MTTICAEHHHKPYSSSPSQQFLKKPFKDLDIPPRKKKSFQDSDMFDSNLHKFLPCNDLKSSDDQDLDPYSSDHFRMYEFKVRRCTRCRSHDWTDCPFAHPGEKARRRDPRKYHYSGTVCPEFRHGGCSRGDSCEFAHGVFESWLHPTRYRTEACKDGKNCKRKVCFFAHSPRQLRIFSDVSYENKKHSHNHSHCCSLACHSVISSPTSTLLGMSHFSPPLSPSLSPPLSPVKRGCGFSPVSRYSDRFSKLSSGIMSYKDVLNELMSSLEAMNVNDQAAAINNTNNNIPWIDIGCLNGGDDRQFILSPSTPTGNYFNAGTGAGDCSSVNRNLTSNFDEYINNNYGGNNGASATAASDPDLGWVNDLLM